MSKANQLAEVPHSNQATLRRLDRHLRGSEKTFRLLFAEHDNIIHRADVIREIGDERDFSEFDVSKVGADFTDFETALFAHARQHRAIHVFGVEDFADEARTKWVQGWNYHRERIAEACPALVLLWLYPEHLTEFALEAPDMWAWRTSVLEFGSPADQMAPLVALSPWDPKPAPANWKQRLVEIEAYLAKVENQEVEADDTVVAGLEAERGGIYVKTGQEELGRPALERARDLFEGVGNDLRGLEQRVRLAEASHGSVDFVDLLQRLSGQLEASISTEVGSDPSVLQELLISTIGLASDIDSGFLQEDLRQPLRYLASFSSWPRLNLLEAQSLISTNRIDEAHTKLLREVIPLVEQSNSPELFVRALLDIGRIDLRRGSYGAAAKEFRRAAKIAERMPSIYLQAIATLGVAEVLVARGETKKARYLLEGRVLPVLRNRLDRIRLAEANLLLAESYHGEGVGGPKITAALSEVLHSIESLKNLRAHNQVLVKLAALLHSLGHFEASLEIGEGILEQRAKLPRSLQAQALGGLAKDHLALGEPGIALKVLQDQLLPLQESDTHAQAATRAEIARISEIVGKQATPLRAPSEETNS